MIKVIFTYRPKFILITSLIRRNIVHIVNPGDAIQSFPILVVEEAARLGVNFNLTFMVVLPILLI